MAFGDAVAPAIGYNNTMSQSAPPPPNTTARRFIWRRLATMAYLVLIVCTNASCSEPTAKPTAKAAARAAQLKATVRSFRLDLDNGWGKHAQSYDHLTLSVPILIVPMGREKIRPPWRVAQIKEEQANKIIDYLATEGFLDEAESAFQAPPPKPIDDYYDLCVLTNDQGKVIVFEGGFGWGPPLLKRLEGLRNVLDGDAAKEMDKLLDTLNEQRKPWKP